MTTSKTVKAATTKTAKAVGNWTEENTSVALTMYQEAIAANTNDKGEVDFLVVNDPTGVLKEIQEKTGAKSVVSVRSKLISEGVYQKADAPRKVGGGNSVRKVHFVRALAAKALEEGVIDSLDAFDSLEQAKAEPLKALAKLLNVEVTA